MRPAVSLLILSSPVWFTSRANAEPTPEAKAKATQSAYPDAAFEENLVDGEISVGYGGGYSLQATAAVAINEEPALYGYGGLVVELRDGKTEAGITGGVRLNPNHGPFRFGAGATYIHTPDTMWGAVASAGACKGVFSPLRLCGDVELTTYFAGSALMGEGEHKSITTIQAVVGIAFDAL